MKKLALIFVLFFAFSFGVNAQTNQKRSPEELALMASKQNTLDASNVLGVDGKIQKDLYVNFLKKNQDLSKSNITDVEKKEIYAAADAKLKAILTKEQVEKLQSDGSYEKLTH